MSSQNDTIPVFYGDFSFNTGKLKQFTILDYVIFAAVLVISAGIGLYHAWKGRKQKSSEDFLLAGRNMSPYPVALSLLASFMSAITLLGVPSEIYTFSTMYFWIGLGYFLVIAGASHIYIPVFYNLGVTSAYEGALFGALFVGPVFAAHTLDPLLTWLPLCKVFTIYKYLEKRFSSGVRTCASMTFVLQMILYMAIVLYAPSLALNAVTGFTLWGSVISVGIVCTLYTALGGMKAVLWTDSFQSIMMVVGLLAILIKAAVVVGGWDIVWQSGQRTDRILFTDFRVDPSVRHSVWSLVFGGYFTWVAIFGVNQAQVQRAVTCPTLRKAQIAMWLNFPGLCIILYISLLIGMFMSAFYEKCDPIKAKFVDDPNQMLPMFVMDVLGDIMGLPGLFVAGLFSGALSTISSGLNSISACVLEDVIRVYFKSQMREHRARLISQIVALIFGAICLGLTYVASLLGNVLQAALSLFGMIGGPLLGVFTLGMIFPWANKWGAYSGLLGSLVLMFWIGVGAAITKPPYEKATTSIEQCNLTSFSNATVAAMFTPAVPVHIERGLTYPLYTLSYLWYSATAVLSCVTIGLLVSFITGLTKPEELDPKVICPVFDILFPFLPERVLKFLRFGVNHVKKHDKPNESELEVEETNGHVLSQTEIKVDEDDKTDYAYDNNVTTPDGFNKDNKISCKL